MAEENDSAAHRFANARDRSQASALPNIHRPFVYATVRHSSLSLA
jgi:hypothetical protein